MSWVLFQWLRHAKSHWTSFHGVSILPPQECRECYFSDSSMQSRWTSFHRISFFLLRNVMNAISVAQAHRVAELAFMGFLFFLLRNVMSAISVAQACRVAELVFMTFRSTDWKNQVVKLSSTPSAMLRWPLMEGCLTCWTPANISAMWYSPRFRQKS